MATFAFSGNMLLLQTLKPLLKRSWIHTSMMIEARTKSAPSATDNVKPKIGSGSTKKKLPVETDTEKLIHYVCGSNIYKEGEDVKLKSDSEYPNWLWNLYIGPPKKLHELDPSSKEYWLKARILARRRNNKLHYLRTKILRKF